jgi:cysteine-rich repeat protein
MSTRTAFPHLVAVRRIASILFASGLVLLSSSVGFAADAKFVSLAQGAAVTGSPNLSYAGTFNIDIGPPFDGPLTEAYCVDINNHIAIGDVEPQVTPDYPCEVVYILNHYYPNAAPVLAPTSHEAAAVQAAIWFFTDGYVITGPADIKTRAEAIIADADASNCVPVPVVPQSMTVTPSTATNFLPDDTSHTVTATLTGSDNQPMAGYPVAIVVTGVSGPQTFPGTTDGAGQFTVAYTNTFAVPGSDTITASAQFTVPVGLKFKIQGKQGIVLAGDPVSGTVQASAQKNWVPAACGDGFINQPGELCDDGNVVEGDGCDSNCTPTACGNGITTSPEGCDDGNLIDGDGCDANCTPTGCGNGIATAGESCDDGNQVNGDGCDTNCTPTACGNGVTTAPELCDDGNVASGDGCDANCTPTICGNGITTAPELCDDGNVVNGDGCDANCTPTGCGNAITTAPELCDDGNVTDNDGCDSNCTEPGCGNGVVNPPEQCDDGNGTNGDGCDVNCTPSTCGNGVAAPPEQCDDGNSTDGDGCDANCSPTACGNGIVTPPEQCDDDNLVDADGCEANCTLPVCGNSIIDPLSGEQCDDGNTLDGDACSSTCQLQEICNDLLDNDGDSLIDCLDPDCPTCPVIFKDPAHIFLRPDPSVDWVKLTGGIAPMTPISPATEVSGFLLDNANGILFRQVLPPGALRPVGSLKHMFVNKTASHSGGLRRFQIKCKNDVCHISVQAYGDLSSATVPTMAAQFLIGDDVFLNKAAWTKTRQGWKQEFPRH